MTRLYELTICIILNITILSSLSLYKVLTLEYYTRYSTFCELSLITHKVLTVIITSYVIEKEMGKQKKTCDVLYISQFRTNQKNIY